MIGSCATGVVFIVTKVKWVTWYTTEQLSALNGLAVKMRTWIVIGQTKQLILSAYQDQAEFSWTDQKTASSPQGHLLCVDCTLWIVNKLTLIVGHSEYCRITVKKIKLLVFSKFFMHDNHCKTILVKSTSVSQLPIKPIEKPRWWIETFVVLINFYICAIASITREFQP